ncbi:MAG: FHA domain-containing protein [Clostridiales bacterium]|nr:FHA domain-containing protein [Clostridiales bacterium]
MAIQQCSNGHIYDDSKSSTCPYCSGENAISPTIALGEVATPTPGFDPTQVLNSVPTGSLDDMPVTVAPKDTPSREGVTQFGDMTMNSEVKPVRGWLVVIEGEKIGMDFRLHTARNTIGRGKKNDISFDFDPGISEVNNVSVIYDDRNNIFFIQAGENSTNNVYVNTMLLLEPKQLKDNDIIEIGSTKLIFRSLCNESFCY